MTERREVGGRGLCALPLNLGIQTSLRRVEKREGAQAGFFRHVIHVVFSSLLVPQITTSAKVFVCART